MGDQWKGNGRWGQDCCRRLGCEGALAPRLDVGSRRGFTLLELLLAAAVMSLAVTLLLSLFFRITDIGETLRYRTLAANLAEAQLAAIQAHPEHYQWRLPEGAEWHALDTTFLFPVLPQHADEAADTTTPESGTAWHAPSVLPALAAQAQQEAARYEQFRWRAFAGAPHASQGEASPAAYAYLELTVEVRWEEAGRPRQLLYTAAVPLSRIPGGRA